MRIVTLEEHFTIPSLVARIPADAIRRRGFPPQGHTPNPMAATQALLAELGDVRIKAMDEAGITVQVLSFSGPGADLLPPDESVPLARDVNDHLARFISAHPGRFAGFAHLPMTAPEKAADELERCVRSLHFVGTLINGMTDEKFLDHPMFEPILARAEQLDVPIYLHPNIPPEAVRKTYFDGLPAPMDFLLSIAGFGWHAETAIHILRLILSGTLERHPKLRLIIGHMGEFLPMTVARTSAVMAAPLSQRGGRSVAQTLQEQVYVTTSGQFTNPPMMALLETFGVDHVLFSVDYPFSPNDRGRRFLDALPLAPADVEQIAHGNADRVLKLHE
jgi:hypothetical protein